MARWLERFGTARTLDLLDANNRSKPMQMLAFRDRGGRELLAESLIDEGLEVEPADALAAGADRAPRQPDVLGGLPARRASTCRTRRARPPPSSRRRGRASHPRRRRGARRQALLAARLGAAV